MVKYEYDSWGNILSIKDASGNNITSSSNIGIINPYRYRSYRYDTETGLYYLQSRYYNSEWGRFINFDNYGGQVGELLSHNGYIYCCNNPVNMIDEDGNFPILITAILAVVVTVVSIATVPQDTWTNIGNSITETATTIGDRISSAVSNISTKKKTNTKTKTQTTTQTTTKTKDNKEYHYKEAGLKAGNVVIGKPISYENDLIRVQTNRSIMCENEYYAIQITKNFPEAIGPEIDKIRKPGKTYYRHYHISINHGDPHIWFYE